MNTNTVKDGEEKVNIEVPALLFRVFDITGLEVGYLRRIIKGMEFCVNSISDSEKKWFITSYSDEGIELIYSKDGASMGYRYPLDLNPTYEDLADFLMKRISVLDSSDFAAVKLTCQNDIFDDDSGHADKLKMVLVFED